MSDRITRALQLIDKAMCLIREEITVPDVAHIKNYCDVLNTRNQVDFFQLRYETDPIKKYSEIAVIKEVSNSRARSVILEGLIKLRQYYKPYIEVHNLSKKDLLCYLDGKENLYSDIIAPEMSKTTLTD